MRNPLIINGQEVMQFRINVRESITESGKYSVRANSVVIINAGTVLATIDGFPLKAGGGSIAFGEAKLHNIIVQEFTIRFAAGAGTKEVYIVETLANHPDLSHYIEQGQFR